MSLSAPRPRLVLASGSPRRLALLAQMGVDPDAVIPADIDESPRRSESPRALAQRLSAEKAATAAAVAAKRPDLDRCITLAADTVVCVGRRVLPKCEVTDEAAACLRLLSGRAHRVYTALTLIPVGGPARRRLVEARVRFKRLSRDEIDAYLAGGYAIQGRAGAFVVRLIGSYTAVVGLPLAETAALLGGEGYAPHALWAQKA
jgi:septum formation protein